MATQMMMKMIDPNHQPFEATSMSASAFWGRPLSHRDLRAAIIVVRRRCLNQTAGETIGSFVTRGRGARLIVTQAASVAPPTLHA